MTTRLRLTTLTLILAAMAFAPGAHAQATRTWVSGVGDDVNPCSRTAPCKTFAGAISKTAAGGEISVLDNGSFGTLTITKSLTVNGDGNLAGVLASLTNGITVNAGVNDVVTIRNISINGAGNGVSGVRYLAGKQLTLDNVTIEGFTSRGVDMSLNNTGRLIVKDSEITRAATGVRVATTSGFAVAVLDNVRLEGMTNGLEAATGSVFVSISDSVITGNATNGILASGATSIVNVDNCQITYNNVNGVNAQASGSIVRLSRNFIANNSAGITRALGATVAASGDNRVVGNSASQLPNDTIGLE